MDRLVKLAFDFGFERVRVNNSGVLVFNCVPGAGKSTLIRAALRADSRFIACTFGRPDDPNGRGCGVLSIEALEKYGCAGRFLLIDEYTEGDWEKFKPKAIFGDPVQASVQKIWPEPDFFCCISRRFGRETARLLRNLGHEVFSEREDAVEWGGVFRGEPRGLVLAYEPEVIDLLTAHNLDYKHPDCCRGLTVSAVTFITALDERDRARPDLQYICLTRHTASLLVLSPNATLGTTGQD